MRDDVTEQNHVNSILVLASGFIYEPTSSNNLGDRAQLTRSVERLKAAFPQTRLVAVANSLNAVGDLDDLEISYTAIRYLTSPALIPGTSIRLPTGIGRAGRILLLLANARRVANDRQPATLSQAGRLVLREMEESSALYVSGAGAFNDLFMGSVAGFWGVIIRSMSTLGKPVVASGQQVGPLTRFSRRALARWALHPIDLLGVRDPRSMKAACAAGVSKRRILLTGDDAWDLAPAKPALARSILARDDLSEPFMAAQLRFGHSVGWDKADAPSVAAALSRLSRELGLSLVFVPCMTGREADDRSAAESVRAHLDVQSWALHEELDARTTKAILGRATMGVGTANHFCVFAASMGTPVIGLHATPYMEQKISGLAELWPNLVKALSKQRGLHPAALVTEANELLAGFSEKAAGAPPSIELHSDAPIRFLKQALAAPSTRLTYNSRYVESHSVDAYEVEFCPGRFMSRLSELEKCVVRSVLRPYRDMRFKRHLDFACGTGRATGFIDDVAEETLGVDVSEEMLKRAQDRYPRAHFVSGDVATDADLLVRVGPFDLVTVWRFIASAEPQLRFDALLAVSRSMANGGMLIVNNNANRTSLHSAVLIFRSLVRRQTLRASRPWRGSLRHRDLCWLLESVGLHVEETRAVSYLPEQVARRIPSRLWLGVERALVSLKIAPRFSVNQIVIARKLSI